MVVDPNRSLIPPDPRRLTGRVLQVIYARAGGQVGQDVDWQDVVESLALPPDEAQAAQRYLEEQDLTSFPATDSVRLTTAGKQWVEREQGR